MPSPGSRLRAGEVLAGLAGLVLLVVLFAMNWLSPHGVNRTGWHALPVLRWVLIVTALAAIALAISQAAMRAPGLPVSLSVVVTVLGLLSALLIAIRMATTSAGLCAGIVVGLVAAAAITVGGYKSMRREQGWTPGPDHPVETVALRPRA